jgi:hypothetical protein
MESEAIRKGELLATLPPQSPHDDLRAKIR